MLAVRKKPTAKQTTTNKSIDRSMNNSFKYNKFQSRISLARVRANMRSPRKRLGDQIPTSPARSSNVLAMHHDLRTASTTHHAVAETDSTDPSSSESSESSDDDSFCPLVRIRSQRWNRIHQSRRRTMVPATPTKATDNRKPYTVPGSRCCRSGFDSLCAA